MMEVISLCDLGQAWGQEVADGRQETGGVRQKLGEVKNSEMFKHKSSFNTVMSKFNQNILPCVDGWLTPVILYI
jgi:hypothetical protein